MRADIAAYLSCPQCHRDLRRVDSALQCGQGHSFDVARQGYVNLLAPPGRTTAADTAAMVAAREEFLATGHYGTLAAAVRHAAASTAAPGCVLDAGAGTGYYLAAALSGAGTRVGIALDLSRYAVRRAARAHPRAGAVVADVRQRLPVRTGGAAVVLDLFAPRNGAEFRRVLHPEGRLVVVTPRPDHLRELVERLDLLTVAGDKDERLARSLDEHFTLLSSTSLRWTLRLARADVTAAVAMGPSGWHVDSDAIGTAIDDLADPYPVTAAVTVSVYRPRP